MHVSHACVKFFIHMPCWYCEAKCVAPVWAYSVHSTFADSIFESSPSKEGFHGTHGTPSGSTTAVFQVGLTRVQYAQCFVLLLQTYIDHLSNFRILHVGLLATSVMLSCTPPQLGMYSNSKVHKSVYPFHCNIVQSVSMHRWPPLIQMPYI